RGGFFPIKQLSSKMVGKSKLLFWNRQEQKTVFEIIPELREKTEKCIFFSELIASHTPKIGDGEKSKTAHDLSIPKNFSKAKQLILMYLKFLEFLEQDVNNLWKRSLDILSIGTIADMVSLTGENRILVQMGLKFITQTKRLGLQNMFTELGWRQKTITEREVSWSIAPILNSSGRLKSAELALELLVTEFPPKAQSLAHELFELNNERKRLATDCLRQVKEFLFQQNDVQKEKILLVNAPIPNQGVTGIVATRLVQEFCRPVIVLLEDHGKFLGSARGFKNINIISVLNHCSDLLEKYGGHVSAAGISIIPKQIELFRKRLKEYANDKISEQDLEDEWKIDAQIGIEEISEELLADLLRFSPFGIDNPPPLFMAAKVPFYEAKKVGDLKNHIRIRFKKPSGQSLMGIGFNLGHILDSEVLCDGFCDIVFSIDLNDFNGIRSIQLIVCDIIFHPTQRGV
ncbi:hypothetical protein HYY75_03240, partial [bacterium]|nr:hypothetical protein [bacterium]